MRRFVFILPSTHAGGGIRVIISLINGLAKRNITVFLYVYSDEKDTRYQIDKRVHVKRWGENGKSKFLRIFGLMKIISYINKNHKKDIVVVTDQITSIFSNLFSVPKVYRYVQADDYNFYDDLAVLKYKPLLKIYKVMTKISYKYRNIKFFFVSKFVYDQYLKYGGKCKKCFILNPPIASGFSNIQIRNENECNIGIVARNHKTKGFSDFVEAVKYMKYKDKVDNIFVLTPDDLIYDTEGMNIIHANNDQEMNVYYNKSHVFISTTWNEGFGLPALEAMKTGCACVICDNGGTREYTKNEENCLIYKGHNGIELANMIDMLISKPLLREKLSKEGIKTADRFNEDKFVERFIRYISKR